MHDDMGDCERDEHFTSYMLTGRNLSDADGPRVAINVENDAVTYEDVAVMGFQRDYDLMIGTSRDLPYACALSIYPVPRYRDALRRDNHMKVTIAVQGVREVSAKFLRGVKSCTDRLQDEEVQMLTVKQSCIPNIGFATTGNSHVVRLCFPGLYEQGQNNALGRELTQREMAQVYDEALRPSMMEVVPFGISHWPRSYKTEMWRAWMKSGSYTFKTIDVDVDALDELSAVLIQKLDELPGEWGKDAYFLHEYKGVKGRTPHGLDGAEVDVAFRDLFRDIYLERLDTSQWFVDVGMEISSRRREVGDSEPNGEPMVLHVRVTTKSPPTHARLCAAGIYSHTGIVAVLLTNYHYSQVWIYCI